jgi:hypothetical protein
MKLLMALALGAVICIPGMAMADMTIVGDSWIIGSWAQGFNETGVTFREVETFMVSGSTNFESPGFESFSDNSWSGASPNPNYAIGTGPSSSNLTWAIKFTGSTADSFAFDFFAWTDSTHKDPPAEYAHAVWNGSGWAINSNVNDKTGEDYDRGAVPIPGALLLLGAGMVRLAPYSRRKNTIV